MNGIETNAGDVAARHRRIAAAVRAELQAAGAGLADRIAADMRVRAPKGVRTDLANSIRAEKRGPFEHFVGPHVDYARPVEDGRKPGKGLPRFGSPEAASATAWLESRLAAAARIGPGFGAWRRARAGSARRRDEEADLQARYFAWSRAVKARGIRAQPFVKPTADAWRERVPAELGAAVRRALERA